MGNDYIAKRKNENNVIKPIYTELIPSILVQRNMQYNWQWRCLDETDSLSYIRRDNYYILLTFSYPPWPGPVAVCGLV